VNDNNNNNNNNNKKNKNNSLSLFDSTRVRSHDVVGTDVVWIVSPAVAGVFDDIFSSEEIVDRAGHPVGRKQCDDN